MSAVENIGNLSAERLAGNAAKRLQMYMPGKVRTLKVGDLEVQDPIWL